MKHIAPLLLLITCLAAGASHAAPAGFADPGMVITPERLMGAATDSGGVGRPRVIQVGYMTHPEMVRPAPIPEPCSAVLLPLGSGLVVWAGRRRPGKRRGTGAV